MKKSGHRSSQLILIFIFLTMQLCAHASGDGVQIACDFPDKII